MYHSVMLALCCTTTGLAASLLSESTIPPTKVITDTVPYYQTYIEGKPLKELDGGSVPREVRCRYAYGHPSNVGFEDFKVGYEPAI